MEGATVEIVPDDNTRESKSTDKSGTAVFSITGKPRSIPYTIKRDGVSISGNVTVTKEGRTYTRMLKSNLTKIDDISINTTLKIKVISEKKLPLEGATVEIAPDDNTRESKITDKSGTAVFSITGTPRSIPYTIERDGVSISGDVTVTKEGRTYTRMLKSKTTTTPSNPDL